MKDALILGWEEWLALSGLGLPAIKAKVDTGTRTSALHATVIEPFGPAKNLQVRFVIKPDPNDPGLEVTCSAPVIDRRKIVSSNGKPELRYIISTEIEVGGHRREIEISLTNRESMSYRMLLGRSAIPDDTIIDPNCSFVQGERSFSTYKNFQRKAPVKRPLRIALLTRGPKNYSSQRIAAAGEARGHIVEMINTSRCYMRIDAVGSEVHYDGKILPQYDAVIPRIGASITSYGTAVQRQFAGTGAYCLNSARSIVSSRDKLLAHQILARAGIGMPVTAFASSPKDTRDLLKIAGNAPVVVKLLKSTQGRGVVLADTPASAESMVDAFRDLDADFLVQEFVAEASGVDTRCFVVGNKVVGAMERRATNGDFRSNLHRGGVATATKLNKEERDVARRAARELGLAVAGVDILRCADGPKVLEVNSSPGLEGIEAATGKDIADKMIGYLERQVRSFSRRSRKRGKTSSSEFADTQSA